MKKTLLFLAFLAIMSIGFAQKNTCDIVYLKNGSIVKGIIVEQIPNQNIKLKTKDGNLFVFKFDEIEKITKDAGYYYKNSYDYVYLKNGSIVKGIVIEQTPNQSIKLQSKNETVLVYKFEDIEKISKENLQIIKNQDSANTLNPIKNRFYSLTEINYGGEMGKYKDMYIRSFGFKNTLGYSLNKHFSAGIAIGLDNYIDRRCVLLPVTIEGSAVLLNGWLSPILNLSLGYSSNLSNYKYLGSGYTVSSSFGIKIMTKKEMAFYLNVGYKWQQFKGYGIWDYHYYSNPFYVSPKTYNVITLSTGISF